MSTTLPSLFLADISLITGYLHLSCVSYNRLSVILAPPIVSLRSFGFCLPHYSCLYFLLYIYSLFLMLSDNLL